MQRDTFPTFPTTSFAYAYAWRSAFWEVRNGCRGQTFMVNLACSATFGPEVK